MFYHVQFYLFMHLQNLINLICSKGPKDFYTGPLILFHVVISTHKFCLKTLSILFCKWTLYMGCVPLKTNHPLYPLHPHFHTSGMCILVLPIRDRGRFFYNILKKQDQNGCQSTSVNHKAIGDTSSTLKRSPIPVLT